MKVEFDKLFERKIKPPFKPDVAYNGAKYVPQEFLEMEAADSVPNKANPTCMITNEFVGFEYEGTPRSTLRNKWL